MPSQDVQSETRLYRERLIQVSEETTPAKEPIKAKTAFMVVQALNGTYYALNQLDTPVDVEHMASLQDMKVGCQEIRDAVYRTDIVNSVKAILTPKEPEPVSSSIREALDERGIL